MESLCPICKEVLFYPAANHALPIESYCKDGCGKFHEWYHGMGDTIITIDGEGFTFFGDVTQERYAEYIKKFESVRAEWEANK